MHHNFGLTRFHLGAFRHGRKAKLGKIHMAFRRFRSAAEKELRRL